MYIITMYMYIVHCTSSSSSSPNSNSAHFLFSLSSQSRRRPLLPFTLKNRNLNFFPFDTFIETRTIKVYHRSWSILQFFDQLRGDNSRGDLIQGDGRITWHSQSPPFSLKNRILNILLSKIQNKKSPLTNYPHKNLTLFKVIELKLNLIVAEII